MNEPKVSKPVECPGFLSKTNGEWIKGTVEISLAADPDTDAAFHLKAEFKPYEPVPNDTRTMTAIVPAAAARKMRRLATFARDQGRIPAEMDVDDELRAMAVLAKTLDSLAEEARGRVLEWVRARLVAAELRHLAVPPARPASERTGFPSVDAEPVGAEESLRLAQERLRS